MQRVFFPHFQICKAMKAKLCRRTTFFSFILTQIVAVVTLFLKLSFWKPMPDDTHDININMRKICWLHKHNIVIVLSKKMLCYFNLGGHDRTCYRARKGHSRSLKTANKQKIFIDKLQFLSRLAQHTLKQFARFSLRDVRYLC